MGSSDAIIRETSAPAKGASFISYSLNYEDVILNRLFAQRKYGFYVDVGAGHPRFENDLYALYKRGWTGVNIEPNRGFFLLYEQVRPRDSNLCMVLSDTAGPPVIYYEIEGSGLSTCDEVQAKDHESNGYKLSSRSVPVDTLAGVLSELGARQIDILKVDVEGFEEKVLGGNDWERFRPSVVLVEATFPESPTRRPTNIRGFMEQRGYRHVMFDGLNDFYLEHSFPEPEGLSLPPNVFDGFVLREIAELREQVESLNANFSSAETYAHSLEANLADLQSRLDDLQKRHEQMLQSVIDGQRAYDDALAAVTSLANENRRLDQQARKLATENRHWRGAAERMRGEVNSLSQLLEPLHSATEQMNKMRRDYESELQLLRSENQLQTSEMQNILQQRDEHLQQLRANLQSVYASRSWFLTKPWRFAGRILKRSRA